MKSDRDCSDRHETLIFQLFEIYNLLYFRAPRHVREVPHADTCGQYRAIFDYGRLHIFDYADYTFCAVWQVINSCLTNISGSPLARILLHSHPPKTGQQTQRGGPCLESFINVSPEIRSCNPF